MIWYLPFDSAPKTILQDTRKIIIKKPILECSSIWGLELNMLLEKRDFEIWKEKRRVLWQASPKVFLSWKIEVFENGYKPNISWHSNRTRKGPLNQQKWKIRCQTVFWRQLDHSSNGIKSPGAYLSKEQKRRGMLHVYADKIENIWAPPFFSLRPRHICWKLWRILWTLTS